MITIFPKQLMELQQELSEKLSKLYLFNAIGDYSIELIVNKNATKLIVFVNTGRGDDVFSLCASTEESSIQEIAEFCKIVDGKMAELHKNLGDLL